MLQSLSSSARTTVRRMFWLVLAVAGIGFALRSFVLAPVYTRFASDIAYSSTWWVAILYLLIDGGLLDLVVFAICYPATLYAVWRAGLRGAIRVPVLYSLLTVVKFAANFLMTSLTDGALPRPDEFVHLELPIILPQLFLEWFQYALMILFVCLWRRSYVQRREAQILLEQESRQDKKRNRRRESLPDYGDAADGEGDLTPARAPGVFPLRSFLSIRHPVEGPLFFTALWLFLGRAFMHFMYQLTLYNWYGATEGWVQMLIDLILDLVITLLFYFLSILQLMKHDERSAPQVPMTPDEESTVES